MLHQRRRLHWLDELPHGRWSVGLRGEPDRGDRIWSWRRGGTDFERHALAATAALGARTELRLTPMWRTWIGLVLCFAAAASSAGAQPVVEVLPQPSLDALESTILEVASAAGSREIEVDLREQVLDVPVQGAPPWYLRCSDPALWCQDLLLLADREGPMPFPIFRRATLTGRMPHRVAGEAIDQVVLQGWVKYSAEESPMLLVLELPVEDGVFRGEVPHAVVDLRIAIPGAAPLYWWDVRPDAEGTLDLGELSPMRGGSLSGFLTAPGEDTPAGATVALEALAAAVPPRVGERLGRMEPTTTADGSGFFQFTGVIPGRYRLVARKDHLRAEVKGVEIEADEELHLRRVPLRGPHSLRARVHPPLPFGDGRWIVVLSGAGIESREESVSESGEVSLEGLHDGTYTLGVFTPQRDRVLERTVTVRGDQEVELHTDLVPVRGEVLLGGEPLLARLVVESGDGDATRLESDHRGILRGSLPRPERRFLRIRVLAPHADVDRTLELAGEEVVVEDGVLHLRLDLPEARVTGKIVDALGQPVQGATLRASAGWLPASEASSGLDGSFLLDGLETGAYWITARHPVLGAGGPILVELPDSDSAVEVLLAMRPPRTLHGSLIADDGSPVAGAQLSISSVGHPFNDFVVTGADGGFEAAVIEDTSIVSLAVLAPSRFLWSGCQRLFDDELVVRLPPGPSGDLRLRLEWDESLPPAAGSLLLLSDSGGVISGDLRRMWREGRGGPRAEAPGLAVEEIPALAPGRWSVLNADEPGWKVVADHCVAHPDPDRRWVTVLPADQSVLEVDFVPYQRQRIDAR